MNWIVNLKYFLKGKYVENYASTKLVTWQSCILLVEDKTKGKSWKLELKRAALMAWKNISRETQN